MQSDRRTMQASRRDMSGEQAESLYSFRVSIAAKEGASTPKKKKIGAAKMGGSNDNCECEGATLYNASNEWFR